MQKINPDKRSQGEKELRGGDGVRRERSYVHTHTYSRTPPLPPSQPRVRQASIPALRLHATRVELPWSTVVWHFDLWLWWGRCDVLEKGPRALLSMAPRFRKPDERLFVGWCVPRCALERVTIGPPHIRQSNPELHSDYVSNRMARSAPVAWYKEFQACQVWFSSL